MIKVHNRKVDQITKNWYEKMYYRELGHYVQRILTYLKKKKSHSKPLYTQGSENLC